MKNAVYIFYTVLLLTLSGIASSYSVFYPNNLLPIIDWGFFLGAIIIASIKFHGTSPLKLTILTFSWYLIIFLITYYIIKYGK